jgi:betaine-aldehyde dehydrogenase
MDRATRSNRNQSHAPMASELPHGGFGSSGYGKDLGLHGIDDYTRIKHVAHALQRPAAESTA